MTGTSTNGPMTAAKASPELIPKAAMATAMASSKLLLAAASYGTPWQAQPATATAIASSKLLLAAVKESVVVLA